MVDAQIAVNDDAAANGQLCFSLEKQRDQRRVFSDRDKMELGEESIDTRFLSPYDEENRCGRVGLYLAMISEA